MKPSAFLAVLFCLLGMAPLAAHEEHGGAKAGPEKMWAEMLAKEQTPAVAATFDAHGRLWRAGVKARRVRVDYSDDYGKTFSAPVTVNAEAEAIGAEGDSRPKIAIGRSGEVYVSWTTLLDKPYTGNVRFSRSLDGGRTFSAPLTVNDNHDVIGHRFDALTVDAAGRVYLAWLDKRDLAAAKKKNEKYDGSALYYAVSEDGGASFSANAKRADHACDCCRIALAVPPQGAPAVFWRHVYEGNVRDHAFARLDGQSEMRRVSRDEWKVEACPHHGPALSVAADGIYHFAWFDNAPQAKGLFYARSADEGKNLTAPLNFGNLARRPGHPDVLSLGDEVWLAWKEFDGEHSAIYTTRSRDGGTSWDAPEVAAATADASDHPLLLAQGGRVFLSWSTVREGYRLIGLGAAR